MGRPGGGRWFGGTDRARRDRSCLVRLTPEEGDHLSLATGQTIERLHAMTLARYEGTGLAIRADLRTNEPNATGRPDFVS